jgi:NAD(P)-dependent dehydrogenase (short-subunit alcohol dehydrogenase family)
MTMKEFRGRTAFVTGGASGIGLGMARAFGRAGMNVVIADIDLSAASAAANLLVSEQIKAAPVYVDVSDRASVRSAALDAVAAFGKIHVVCNNAGVAVGGPLGTLKERDWDWIIDVNLKGVVYGTEVFTPLMRYCVPASCARESTKAAGRARTNMAAQASLIPVSAPRRAKQRKMY